MEEREEVLEAKDLNRQGIALLKAGKTDEAGEKFFKAIDVEPMLMESYKNIGDMYMLIEDYPEAKNYYKKALLIEKSGEVYFRYGNACIMNDELQQGLKQYNYASSQGYENDEMYYFMAMSYENMDDDQLALRYIQKAIIINPVMPEYKVKKIALLLNMNRVDDAKQEVDHLIISDPDLFDGYHLKNMILMQESNWDEAVTFSKKAMEKFPEDVELMYDHAKALGLSGKCEDALKIIEISKKMKYFEDSRAKMTLLEAEIEAELGNIDNAYEKCNECISYEQDEVDLEARYMRINLSIVLKKYEDAINDANVIIDSENRGNYYFSALYYRGICALKLGKNEEAENYFKDAIALYRLATLERPDAFEAYLYRVMCLKELKEYDKALELLEFIEKLSDEVAEVYTIRADIYSLMGKEVLAKEELKKAYELKPELKELFTESGD